MSIIAVDVSSFLASRTGVGVCVAQLLEAMLAGPAQEAENKFRICALSISIGAVSKLRASFPAPNREICVRPVPIRLLRRIDDGRLAIEVERLFGIADVFHASHLFVPPSRRVPIVMTVYDLTPIRFPQFHIPSNRFTLDDLKRWLRRVELVITTSKCTAVDLQEYTGLADERLRIVPLGIKKCFRPGEAVESEVAHQTGLGGDYILMVGALEPRKNLPRLLQAFRLLKDRHQIPHKLAIVGSRGWMEMEIYRAVRELRLSDAVVFTGYVEEETLNRLYNRAALLVYPSLYEGFGLPPLEAMAAGCPVAVSRSSSLPEVVGDAGLYFDPMQVEDIADTVYRILASKNLKSKLVELGLYRSRQFSWARAAEATLRAYEDARSAGEMKSKGR